MDGLHLVARNGDAVRQALELGEILHLETASEEITDEFLLFAINSGLLRAVGDGLSRPAAQPRDRDACACGLEPGSAVRQAVFDP